MANRNIAQAALNNYVQGSQDLDAAYKANMGNVARQVEANRQATQRRAANKLGRNSGTYKLMREKMAEAGANEFNSALLNKAESEQDLQKQRQNNLNQRDLFSYGLTPANIPAVPPVEPNHTMAAIQGGLQGAMQGASMGAGIGQGIGQIQSMGGGAPGAWTGFQAGGRK
jgi:hypothetical protein